MKVINFLETTLRNLGNWLRTLRYATYKIKVAVDANGEEFYVALIKEGRLSPYKLVSRVYRTVDKELVVLGYTRRLTEAYRFNTLSNACKCAEKECERHNWGINNKIVSYTHFFKPLD